FNTLVGFDIKEIATQCFAMNSAHQPIMMTTDIKGESTKEALLAHLASRGITGPGQLDCLVGGPPCEGFSQNRVERLDGGAAGGRSTKFTDDPRNRLFKWFIEIASILRPSVILIENVPDLLRHRDGETAREVVADLDKLGYLTIARVLNAADYGVPQLRRRAFFLAQRKEDYQKYGVRLRFPEPTHMPYPMGHESLDIDLEWLPGDMGYWTTVREAIGDLPRAIEDKSAMDGWSPYSDESKQTRTILRSFLRSRGEGTWNHVGRSLGPNGLTRVREIEELTKDRLHARQRERVHYHYAYSRLRWAEPARTITKFVYHVGSGMFCHPDEYRAITMREAARLQTFPDSFKFPTATIREMSSLIGSAVPPLLARTLSQQLVRYLDAVARAKLDKIALGSLRELKGDAVVRRLENIDWLLEGTLRESIPEDE
ncbi:MAG: DNA cytosine methyltransferase, partial [Ktedonobacteraceae bacterium]